MAEQPMLTTLSDERFAVLHPALEEEIWQTQIACGYQAATIHRQMLEIAKAQGWKALGDERVRPLITCLDSAIMALAHQEAAASRKEFDLSYWREAGHANAIWQTVAVLLLDDAGKPARPHLATIESDDSWMIVGCRLRFQPATALTTVLEVAETAQQDLITGPGWSDCADEASHNRAFSEKRLSTCCDVYHTDLSSEFSRILIQTVSYWP